MATAVLLRRWHLGEGPPRLRHQEHRIVAEPPSGPGLDDLPLAAADEDPRRAAGRGHGQRADEARPPRPGEAGQTLEHDPVALRLGGGQARGVEAGETPERLDLEAAV